MIVNTTNIDPLMAHINAPLIIDTIIAWNWTSIYVYYSTLSKDLFHALHANMRGEGATEKKGEENSR